MFRKVVDYVTYLGYICAYACTIFIVSIYLQAFIQSRASASYQPPQVEVGVPVARSSTSGLSAYRPVPISRSEVMAVAAITPQAGASSYYNITNQDSEPITITHVFSKEVVSIVANELVTKVVIVSVYTSTIGPGTEPFYMSDRDDVYDHFEGSLSNMGYANNQVIVQLIGYTYPPKCKGDPDGDGYTSSSEVYRFAYRFDQRKGSQLYSEIYDPDLNERVDAFNVQEIAGVCFTTCDERATSANQTKQPLSASNSPTVTNRLVFNPQDISSTVGQTTTIALDISRAENFGGFEFTFGYNPNVISVTKILVGPFPGSTGRTVMPLGPLRLNDSKVSFGAFSLGASPEGPNGTGTIALIEIQVIGEGHSDLIISNPEITDITGKLQGVVTTLGSISTSGSSTPTVVPTETVTPIPVATTVPVPSQTPTRPYNVYIPIVSN